MEICKSHKECFTKICSLCEDYEPLSSHAVLSDGWRDARKELPKNTLDVLICVQHGTRFQYVKNSYVVGCYVDDSEYYWQYYGKADWDKVIAWRPLPDPPVFA